MPKSCDAKLFSVSCVRLGRTVASISSSRKLASDCPRPSLRSQPPTSMGLPLLVMAQIVQARTVASRLADNILGRVRPGRLRLVETQSTRSTPGDKSSSNRNGVGVLVRCEWLFGWGNNYEQGWSSDLIASRVI